MKKEALKSGNKNKRGKSVLRWRQKPGRIVKKKTKKKPDNRIRFLAVLTAAFIIFAVFAVSLTVFYLHSAKETLPVPQKTIISAKEPATDVPVGNTQTPQAKQLPITPPALSPTVPARNSEPARPSAETRAIPALSTESTSLPAAVIEKPAGSAAAEKGTLAFVIDDAGNNLRDLEPFLKFPGALTIAVLPGLPSSAEAARRIRAAGKEVFLHQPMESLGGRNPGPGAIFAGMDSGEIRRILNRNLDELWPVAGINNHEGSRVTMNDAAMETVLAVCRERGIVFLDSRTTVETAAPRAAERLGMKIGERDVFVDNIQEKDSMLGYINSGLSKAAHNGSAILIGHVWSPALAPLMTEQFPGLSEQGFSFSSVSKLVRDSKSAQRAGSAP